jgi:hypothetical protein
MITVEHWEMINFQFEILRGSNLWGYVSDTVRQKTRLKLMRKSSFFLGFKGLHLRIISFCKLSLSKKLLQEMQTTDNVRIYFCGTGRLEDSLQALNWNCDKKVNQVWLFK